VLRGGAGTLIGRATGVLATQRTPSGRTDNLLYAYGEVAGAVDLAARLLRLAAAVAESLTVDHEAAARALQNGFAQATDLAEIVSGAAGIDYRSAYRVVGCAVAEVAAAGCAGRAGPGGRLDAAAIDAAAREVLGRGLELPARAVADALDPAACLATRTAPGGAAPAPMDAMLAECREAAAEAQAWEERQRAGAARAEAALVQQARGT
jgi:argininosuccinate lyase